jgi:hypothetical protein
LRGTLVLVPTFARVPAEVAARFAPGEHVEVCALADVLRVRDGALTLAAASHASTPAATSSPPPAPAPLGLAARLGVTRWEDVRLSVVDDHTLRIESKGQTLLRTFVELGFVDARKKDVVRPVIAWGMLLLLCKKGEMRPSEYGEMGKAFAAKKAIERLGAALREAFGLEEHPVRTYSRRDGRWAPRFRVAAPDDARAKPTRKTGRG